MRAKIGPLIEQWQKISLLTERLVKRREAAAVRNPHALFKRTFLSTYLTPNVNVPSTYPSSAPASLSSPRSLTSSLTLPVSLPSSPLIGSYRPDGTADGGFYTPQHTMFGVDGGEQADMSRLQITLNALNEVNETCWRGEYCELCVGVRAGLETVSGHLAREADEAEQRVRIACVLFLLLTPLIRLFL